MKLFFGAILALSFCFPAFGALTRQELLKGAQIPEKRQFAESAKYPACENFHKYVCDQEESSFKLPADRAFWYFSFSDNSERILQARKNFFKKISKGFNPEGERIAQVKNFYKACMDAKASAGSEKAYVNKVKEQYASLKSTADFRSYISKNLGSAEFTGLQIASEANQQDPNFDDVLLLGVVATFPVASYYKDPAALADLESLAADLFKDIGFKDWKERAKQLVQFETQFNEFMPLPAEFRQLIGADTYKPREQFVSSYGNIDWKPLFSRIPERTKLRDFTSKVLSTFNTQLGQADRTTLESVFVFHSLKDYLDDGYPNFQKKYQTFRSKYEGVPAQRSPRDERCTQSTVAAFSFEIDEYLIPILFPDFPQEKVIALAERVRQAILQGLDKNQWLSKAAKVEAKKKMSTAPLHLVKPSRLEDWDFKSVRTYSSKNPIENSLIYKQALMDKMFEDLKSNRNRQKWGYSPLTLNAYYQPSDNHFFLLQGILQPPFFDPNASEIENFGAIGSVVGHELGHGIDDSGARFDSEGKVRQWMTIKDLGEFSKRGSQFASRFDAVGHNGRLTLGENIGDHVGVTFSYAAAFEGKSPSKEEKQRFFKAYARVWCSVYTPAAEQSQIKTDPHSIGRERINQQVIHIDGFYDAFDCKAGDKMYVAPSDRIRIW